MKYPKICAHCQQCQNSPYGDWYCVDKNGKVIKELQSSQEKACENFNLSEICKRMEQNDRD